MMEQISDTTFEVTLSGGDKVEIGDKESTDFKPLIKLNRWDGECSLTLSIPTNEKILPTISGSKILWKGKNYGAEFYQEAGGFKFNIILSKKPKTNMFPLDFDSGNLKFYYQPPLTEEYKDGFSEEFKEDISVAETQVTGLSSGIALVLRPENVVGSYAVYHATRGNIHAGADAEKYKCGVAFHWFRPLIYDNAGNKCWGILNVGQGVRTVTVPQDFLDNAVYPVVIDDFFGSDADGQSSKYTVDRIYGSIDTPSSTGVVSKISAYLRAFSSSFYGNARAGLYISPDYDRGDFHSESDEVYINWASVAWHDWNYSTSPEVSDSVVYAIVLHMANYTYISYNAAEVDNVARESEEYSYGSGFPEAVEDFNVNYPGTLYRSLFSIYCTYEEVAPPAAEGGAQYARVSNLGILVIRG